MPYKNLSKIPIYRKSLDLLMISREIASYLSYNKDLLKLYQSNSLRDIMVDSLLTDSILISQQIAEAERSESHAVRMRSATFINVIIRNINSYCIGLEKDGVKEKEYLNLLKSEVKSFRRMYKVWRRSMRG